MQEQWHCIRLTPPESTYKTTNRAHQPIKIAYQPSSNHLTVLVKPNFFGWTLDVNDHNIWFNINLFVTMNILHFFLECFECLCCCEIPKVKEKPWLQTVRLVSVWKRCQNLDTFCMILQTFYRPEMIKTIWRAFTSVRGLSGDCGGSVPLVFVSPWVFGANRPVVEWHSEWLNAWRNLQTRLFFFSFQLRVDFNSNPDLADVIMFVDISTCAQV